MTVPSAHVLVVDDDAAHAEALGEALETFGHEPRVVRSGEEGLAALRDGSFDVVLTDLRMAGVDGMKILEAARRRTETDVVMVTGHGSVESAVEALHAGAADYITKPVNLGELRQVLERILEAQRLRRRNRELETQLDERFGFDQIIGRSDAMQTIFRLIRQVAPTDVTVLVSGESGTGKELVARALHQNSRRRAAPFVVLNCAALPEGILESELFGHEKGAFTGAIGRKAGHIENASGGTLMLDEVGEAPASTQVKLLRVLEQREIVRLGSTRPIPVDIRVIAATNKNLLEEVAEHRFREDLYFRLKVVSIDLPPLRVRLDDIPFLVEAFLRELSAQHGMPARAASPDLIATLQAQPWPGNVRELRNVVEFMVVTADHETLVPADLPLPLQDHVAAVPVSPALPSLAGRTALDVEREHVRATLEAVGGNRAKAARLMGIGERTLYRKIRQFGLR